MNIYVMDVKATVRKGKYMNTIELMSMKNYRFILITF